MNIQVAVFTVSEKSINISKYRLLRYVLNTDKGSSYRYFRYYKVEGSFLFLLIDFSLTVKAAAVIFISGCGSAISSSKEGKSGFIYNFCKELISFLAAQTCVHFMKILTKNTRNSHFLTLTAHNHKMYVFVVY